MGLRSCDTTHFVRTISCGLLKKVPNTDTEGVPGTVYKNLKDVYEHETAIRLQKYDPELLFDSVKVKLENCQFSLEDRTLQEIETKDDEFVCKDGNSELDDDLTLRNLKKMCLTKKRKYNLSKEHFIQGQVNKNPEEDDLNEPIINFKKNCSKVSKDKRRCKSPSVPHSSHMDINIKPENLSSEDGSVQVVGFDPVIHVKTEVPDTIHMECQNEIVCASDGPSIGHDEEQYLTGVASNPCQEMSAPDGPPIGHDEEQYPRGVVSNPCQEMVHHVNTDLEHKNQNCVIIETSDDHAEEPEAVCMPVPLDGTSINLEFFELGGGELSDLPPLMSVNVIENGEALSFQSSISPDPNLDVCGGSSSSSIYKMSQQSTISGNQVSNTTSESDYPLMQDGNLKCGTCPDSVISLQTRDNAVSAEDIVTDEVQTPTDSFDATMKNALICESHFEDKFLKAKENETLESSVNGAESQSSLKSQCCGSSGTLSAPRLHSSPERLLSTKKAISPSSQERLCMAMNSIELRSDADQFGCKEKHFGKETGKKAASTVNSEFQYDKVPDNNSGCKQISPCKVTISSRNVIKKSKIAKGNLEGPHFSRSLPNLSTGCTSIQGCSESAIAFSQRQMHDMESLAEKLMNELKSMKDIVEQKLLFEAYRNTSLKSDADGVKQAINNATKVEDTAKRWLSMMSRDCTCFCKIMKMTPTSTTSKDSITREKRIVFADEAGGKLCHVKLFGDDDLSSTDDERKCSS